MTIPENFLRDAVLLLSAAGVIGGVVIAWAKWKLSGDFAGRADIVALSAKVTELDTKLATVPTHDDIRRLGERLTAMESGVSSIAAELRGMRDGIGRVERTVEMLLTNELNKQKAIVP